MPPRDKKEKVLSFDVVWVKKLMVESPFHFEKCGYQSLDMTAKWQNAPEERFTTPTNEETCLQMCFLI